MSSILKALRKLEEEKSVQKEGSVDIARDILRLPHRRRSSRHPWLLPVAGAVLLTLAAVILGLFLTRKPEPLPPVLPAMSAQPLTPPAAAPPIPPEVKVPDPVSSERAVSAPSSSRTSRSLRHLPAEEAVVEVSIDNPQLPSLAEKHSASPERKKASAVSVKSSRPFVPPLPPLPKTGVTTSASGKEDAPSFRLSGIAYQDDPEGRVAVVNGLPVMRGTAIEGATVKEILPDRVRLDLPGGGALDLFLEP